MKTKIRKTANILIRATIVVLTFVFIYDQVFHRKNYQEILDYFPTVTGGENFYFLLSVVLLLIPVNLFLEVWKWKYLIKKLEKVSLECHKSNIDGLFGEHVSTKQGG